MYSVVETTVQYKFGVPVSRVKLRQALVKRHERVS